jgi:hypothetical protein
MFLHGDTPRTGVTGTPPAGVLPCVWMSAGLISFKLCDREGECEGCPFDRAMRGLPSLPPLAPASRKKEPCTERPPHRVRRPHRPRAL